MKQLFKITLTSLILITNFQPGTAQSIKDLDFLIGSWDVHETIVPGTDREYTETGIRTCEYYMQSYIRCEAQTTVTKSGHKREYAYFINYVPDKKCFVATNLASDFPLMGAFEWRLNASKDTIIYAAPKNVREDRFFRGTLVLENPDKIVWQGWSSKWDEDKAWKHIFRDVATRRK